MVPSIGRFFFGEPRFPTGERHGRKIFALHDVLARDIVGFFDGEEQIDLRLGQGRDIDDQARIGRVHVAQIDNVGNARVGRAIAGPDIIGAGLVKLGVSPIAVAIFAAS